VRMPYAKGQSLVGWCGQAVTRRGYHVALGCVYVCVVFEAY